MAVLALSQRAPEATVAYLKPGVTAHPLMAAADDWKFVARDKVTTYAQVYAIAPVQTRGMRVAPAKPAGSIEYNLGGPLVLLASLGEGEEPPTLVVPPAPYTIPYSMPMKGFVALNVLEKKTGKIIRRVMAEAARDKGPMREPWDLEDEAKQLVPAGVRLDGGGLPAIDAHLPDHGEQCRAFRPGGRRCAAGAGGWRTSRRRVPAARWGKR